MFTRKSYPQHIQIQNVALHFVAFRITPDEFQGGLAATVLQNDVSLAQGVFTEALLTGILITTILGCTNRRRKGDVLMATIPIGFAVSIGVLSGVLHHSCTDYFSRNMDLFFDSSSTARVPA